MCEGPSLISGPIPPDPTLFPEYYRRPSSARGRLEGNLVPGASPLLSGTLFPDPAAQPGSYSARTTRPPRINPNATHILERGQRGVVGSLLKLEGVSLTPQPKHKIAARDFGKENVRRLREIQKKCREQEAQKERTRPVPVKALWISPKYREVQSRVMTQHQETSPPKKPECQNFLRAHSAGARPQLHPSAPAPPALPSSPSAPSLSSPELQLQIRGRTVDFVSHNARAASKTALRRSQSLTNLRTPPSAEKGRVPQYLVERKEQWKKEEELRKKNTPDPSIPAGHTQMPEKDRQNTLQSLQESHRALVSELLSLPVRTDTLGVRTRRTELDRRLSELEEAIKIFSRDKVYVKIDS